MMKKRQNEFLDENLRRRLENTDSPVPDNMWSRIQAARQDKRIHPLGWYYFSASILVVASIALWLSFHSPSAERPTIQHEEQPVYQDAPTADQQNSSTQTADITNASDQVDQTNQTLQNETNTVNTTDQQERQSQSASTVNQSVEKGSNTGKRKTQKSGTAGSSNAGSIQASNKNQSSQDRFKQDAANTVGQNLAQDDARAVGTDRPTGSNVLNRQNDAGQKAEVFEIDYRFATTDKLFQDQVAGVQSNQTHKLPGIGKSAKRKATPSCYSFNSFLRGLSVDAYFAPEYASRQLVYKDPSMIGYAEQRKNDESYMFAYSAGFRINAHFRGGLALRTGLIYTDITEKLEYRDENAQVTKVINVTLDTIYQNGNIVYVWDTLSVTEYGSYNKIGYNRYRFYDIPLMVGYEIDRGNWVIQLNTGILFNIAASQRGDFLDPDHQLVNFDSNNEQGYQAFRTHVGSSLLMSMGFNYALRPKLHLLLEPQLRVWMKPLNIQAYPIDQKYVNLGVAMGIRQYF
ncbi:MAG: hypothetical protein K9I85_14370 [Saprospiraceae bacterium]|nr:hypothetical protein [Saprospiraceae bacterium]